MTGILEIAICLLESQLGPLRFSSWVSNLTEDRVKSGFLLSLAPLSKCWTAPARCDAFYCSDFAAKNADGVRHLFFAASKRLAFPAPCAYRCTNNTPLVAQVARSSLAACPHPFLFQSFMNPLACSSMYSFKLGTVSSRKSSSV